MNAITILTITLSNFLLGGIGLFVAGQRVDYRTRRERWVKFFTYFLITHTVLTFLYCTTWFPVLAILITTAGGIEIFVVIRKARLKTQFKTGVALFYGLSALGFCCFAFTTRADVIIYVYLVVMLFDGFSQVCGQLMGRRKFLPYISPNKTLEGTLGGWILTLCICMVMHNYFHMNSVEALVSTTLMCLAAFSGDILASWNKRLAGVKDYGRILPGHGGVLDRFDSFMLAGGVNYLLSLLLLL